MSSHTSSTPSEEDHGGNAKYIYVFIALCVLTGMSFFTYSPLWPSALDSDAIKRTFMMVVSCIKALLVILFFMHVKWEANWKYVMTIPASMMALFLLLMLIPDIGMRLKHVSRERAFNAAEDTSKSEGEHENGHEEAPSTDEHAEGHH